MQMLTVKRHSYLFVLTILVIQWRWVVLVKTCLTCPITLALLLWLTWLIYREHKGTVAITVLSWSPEKPLASVRAQNLISLHYHSYC